MEPPPDDALAANVSITLLGPYLCTDAGVKGVRFRSTMFVPPPFVGI